MPITQRNEAPINSTDAMFDGIVTQERNIGLMIDLCSFEEPRIKPTVSSTILHDSNEYGTAMERRLARLLNNCPGKERLYWESESFDMGFRTAETSTKNVCYVNVRVPITEDQRCDCGRDEPDHECPMLRKELSVLFIFDLEPTDSANKNAYRSEERRGRVILDHELSSEDGFAWLRAHWKTMQTDWTSHGQNDLDLNALWLHIFNALIPIAAETARFHQDRRRLRARAAAARAVRLARRMAKRLVLPTALTARELLDRLRSWLHSVPLSSPPADDAMVAAETMTALDSPSHPCIHGYYPDSCEDCDDES